MNDSTPNGAAVRPRRALWILGVLLALGLSSAAHAQGPVTDLICDPIAGTADVAMSWTLDGPYDSIRIVVNGTVAATLPPTATFATVPGLPAGLHTLCVLPTLVGAALPDTCCEVMVTPPAPPGPLTCDPIAGSFDVALTWVNNDPYAAIEVYVDGVLVDTLPGSDTFYVASGLGPGTHEICLRAIVGSSGLPAVCCTVTFPGGGGPLPPSDLNCDPLSGTTRVALAWTNNGAYSFIDVCVDGVVIATLPGGDTFFTTPPLGAGPHEICIKAHDATGTLIGEECCTVTFPGGGPFPPSDLNCDPIGGTTEVAFAWTNNGAYAAIEICVDGVVIATLPGTATFFTTSPLGAGPHEICVKANDVTGLLLGEICCDVVFPGGGPTPPSDLGCDPLAGTTRVALAWTNNGAYAFIDICVDGVVIATLPGGDTFFTTPPLGAGPHEICVKAYNAFGGLIGEECCTVTFPGGTPDPLSDLICEELPNTQVSLSWTNTGPYDFVEICVEGVVIATFPGPIIGAITAPLGAGDFVICVKAYDAAGVLLDEECCDVFFPPQDPPSDLGCDPIFDTTRVALAWTNNGAYSSVDICVDGTVIATLPGTTTSFTTPPLGAGSHVICIKAYDSASNLIGEECCDVEFPPEEPPTDLGCDPLFGTGDVAIAWSNNGTYASIEICVDGNVVATLPGSDTSFTVTGVASGGHTICVKAYDAAGGLIGEACCEVVIDLPTTFVRGDCNADGSFDISDLISLLGFLFSGATPPPCADACDTNDDGSVNVGDAIYGLGALFSGGPPIPAPHPACGPDPTADALGCASFPPCP